MKKVYLLIFAITVFINGFSQSDYRKQPALGFSFVLNDFKTAAEIRSNGLVSVLRAKNLFRTSRMNIGIGINYLDGLSDHVDFIGTLSTFFGNNSSTSTG